MEHTNFCWHNPVDKISFQWESVDVFAFGANWIYASLVLFVHVQSGNRIPFFLGVFTKLQINRFTQIVLAFSINCPKNIGTKIK